MATITVSKGLIGKEDVSFEDAGSAPTTFSRTKAGGGTQSITKIAPAHLNLEDTGTLITATNVEDALQEIAGDIDDLQVIASNGKGADISYAATIAIPSRHLYFDITGTTNISAIAADASATAGRLIILQFDSSLTVLNSSTLKLEGDYEAKAGDQITLIYDGSSWFEVSRTAPTRLFTAEFTVESNEEIGEVRTLGGGHFGYSQGNPLNGFIGGQNDLGF